MARMTFYHKELLVDFIEMNRSMVRGKDRGDSCDAEECRRLWDELAARLTAAGAVARSGEEWKKAWGELLCRTKKMARVYAQGADSGKLTPLEHRILAAGQGNLTFKTNGGQHVPRRTRRNADAVKCEAVFTPESPPSCRNEDDALLLPLPPRPTSPPSPSTRNGRMVTESPCDPDLYPSWLVETERLRADAVTRCADALTSLADSSRVQAEAIVRLADAAGTQADAVARIAKSLESKFS